MNIVRCPVGLMRLCIADRLLSMYHVPFKLLGRVETLNILNFNRCVRIYLAWYNQLSNGRIVIGQIRTKLTVIKMYILSLLVIYISKVVPSTI